MTLPASPEGTLAWGGHLTSLFRPAQRLRVKPHAATVESAGEPRVTASCRDPFAGHPCLGWSSAQPLQRRKSLFLRREPCAGRRILRVFTVLLSARTDPAWAARGRRVRDPKTSPQERHSVVVGISRRVPPHANVRERPLSWSRLSSATPRLQHFPSAYCAPGAGPVARHCLAVAHPALPLSSELQRRHRGVGSVFLRTPPPATRARCDGDSFFSIRSRPVVSLRVPNRTGLAVCKHTVSLSEEVAVAVLSLSREELEAFRIPGHHTACFDFRLCNGADLLPEGPAGPLVSRKRSSPFSVSSSLDISRDHAAVSSV